MKLKIFSAFLFAITLGTLVSGCGSDSKPVDVPSPERVERKPWEQMSKEEKIDFIQRTPMPEEAKAKQIKSIQAGTM